MSKIGIITLSRIKISQRETYNMQDIGLARAIAGKGHEVILYRFTQDMGSTETMEGIRLRFYKSAGIGRQTIADFTVLDQDLERLICFSDNQVSFPALYRWCLKRDILLQPYVGVLRSNSDSRAVSAVTNALLWRNIRCYRKLKVYAKTPAVQEEMRGYGISRTGLIPVCLDETLLHRGFEQEDRGRIRRKWGYAEEDRILLYIGRMEPEKEPGTMLRLMKMLCTGEEGMAFQLIMVGKGKLLGQVKAEAGRLGISEKIRFAEHVANQDIWQLYCLSDCYVNLNRHEIFGMSILEAFYYNCPVIARRAPGPEYIMKDILPEGICDNTEEAAWKIRESVCRADRKRTRGEVEKRFLWEHVADGFW